MIKVNFIKICKKSGSYFYDCPQSLDFGKN